MGLEHHSYRCKNVQVMYQILFVLTLAMLNLRVHLSKLDLALPINAALNDKSNNVALSLIDVHLHVTVTCLLRTVNKGWQSFAHCIHNLIRITCSFKDQLNLFRMGSCSYCECWITFRLDFLYYFFLTEVQ